MGTRPPAKSGAPPTKKPSGKKAKPLTQAEQSARFKETARELDVDESGRAFDRAIARLLPDKP